MAHRETQRHRDAFESWWANDRRSGPVAEKFAVSDTSVRHWVDWFAWHARADARDASVKAKQDRLAADRRSKMLERHRRAGELLVVRGMERMGTAPIEHAKDAIAAIRGGIEVERQADGLPTWALEIVNANPDQLRARLAAIETSLATAREGADPGDLGADGGAGEDDPGCLGPDDPTALP